MNWGGVFGKIIREVGCPRPPIYFELPLRFAITQPVKSHVHCLRAFGLDFLINYVWIGVRGCGCPISVSICRRYTASFALMKIAPNSASAADDITALIIVAMVRIAPLLGGLSTLFDRKKCPPARLRDFVSLQYPASLWTASIMLLAW